MSIGGAIGSCSFLQRVHGSEFGLELSKVAPLAKTCFVEYHHFMSWTIPFELDQERLDQALVKLSSETSRAQWQKRIKNGEVLVDGEPITSPHAPVREGSEVRCVPRMLVPTAAKKTQKPVSLAIIHETKDWMVINKPAGLLVHPAASADELTLVDSLLAHDPAIAKVGGEPERPGIVHRLDREVSGLMLVAKTERGFEALKEQFQQRKIKKQYLALVHGVVAKDEGDIRFTLTRSTTKGRMAARPEQDEEGKAAWTHYAVLERLPGATLLKVDIFSGRTHQIRAHLFALGHPVIGDPLYVKRNTDRRNQAPRLMLQSTDLAFTDPITHEERVFHLDPEPAFAKLIQAWKIG